MSAKISDTIAHMLSEAYYARLEEWLSRVAESLGITILDAADKYELVFQPIVYGDRHLISVRMFPKGADISDESLVVAYFDGGT